VELGEKPTPVQRLPAFWVKRDDLLSPRYGGNKVRKLEHLLDEAQRRGAKRVVTMGAAGSHHVVATAIYGRDLGLAVEAVLVPQPATEHAKQNLRVALAHGLSVVTAPAWSVAPLVAATRMRRRTYFIPLGGSNAIGSLGYVEAAHELAAQVRGGELDEPDVVVVAIGSGGTAAGLAVGFEQAGLRTRVHGVVVSPPVTLVSALTRRVTHATAKLAGISKAATKRAVERIMFDGSFLGGGYGRSTPASAAAMIAAKEQGILLDEIYTAKAYACALTHREEHVVFWHTLSSARLAPADDPLPPRLAALFR
jgi:1-aminocyclopropane-1-carboxylate deaminase/D-cysteine desulfhydrase-like pyridoxal-dependent ACC family enzyme